MKKLLALFLLLIPFTLQAEEPVTPKKQVLLIGDSISIGYTPHVIKLLEKDGVVKHHPGNAGPTLRGLDEIDKWIGTTKWDVIHFNWGLWDMYRWRYEQFDQSPAAYEKNLEKLVTRLKQTNAKLIWATTTPACPEPEKKIKIQVDPSKEQQYLAAAKRVMTKHKIQINDLHKFMKPQWERYKIADNDVHYSPAGKEALGKQVAKVIKAELK